MISAVKVTPVALASGFIAPADITRTQQFLIEGLPKNTPVNKTAQRPGFINIGTTLIQGLVKVFPQVMSIPEHPTLKTNNFN